MNMQITEASLRRDLEADYELFASSCLTIRDKAGHSGKLWFNRAQRYLHDRLEKQRAEKGYVRAIVLKGRKQGVSTYVGGRHYHQATHRFGARAYILTHMQEATDNLFEMIERFHESNNPLVKPQTGAANAKELNFKLLDSGYKVGTAGSKGVGRSDTIQLFHGCLSPHTLIVDGLTDSLRQMGSFVVGDMVRTHTGHMAPISFISRQAKTAKCVTVKGLTPFPLVATNEHRFWTPEGWRDMGKLSVSDHIGFPVSEIIAASTTWQFRLEDTPRPQGGGTRETGPRTIAPDYNLGRVLGLFLAEGCIKRQHKSGIVSGVEFAVHEREVARTIEWLAPLSGLFRNHPKIQRRKDSKTVVISVRGRSFAAFVLARCGELDTKHLPVEWRVCGKEFVRGLIHGYLAGDGSSSHRANDRRISAPSIRSAITIGIRDALASLGYGWACIGYQPAAIRHGRDEREQWILRLCGEGVDHLCNEIGWTMPPRKRTGDYGQIEVKDGYAWLPICAIDDAGIVDVMDFEINHPDHSYCTVHSATHNSEVAFWPNAEVHAAGIIQAVPLEEGTEIILESTANGFGNYYADQWALAAAGKSEYQAIFIPWFWQKEYRRPVPDGFEMDQDEQDQARAYGLDAEQIYWRRMKIVELGEIWRFTQEYPSTPEEAFQSSGEGTFIKPLHVAAARRAHINPSSFVPITIGVDPARGGRDSTAIIDRQGRRAGGLIDETIDEPDAMRITARLVAILRKVKPRKIFIDATDGTGQAIYDRMVELGYEKYIEPVKFSHAAIQNDRYLNKRAEMWDEMREWLANPVGVQIPDDDDLQKELCAPIWGPGATRHNSNGKMVLEEKDHIRKRIGVSPDKADALALTFAAPIAAEIPNIGTIVQTHAADTRVGY